MSYYLPTYNSKTNYKFNKNTFNYYGLRLNDTAIINNKEIDLEYITIEDNAEIDIEENNAEIQNYKYIYNELDEEVVENNSNLNSILFIKNINNYTINFVSPLTYKTNYANNISIYNDVIKKNHLSITLALIRYKIIHDNDITNIKDYNLNLKIDIINDYLGIDNIYSEIRNNSNVTYLNYKNIYDILNSDIIQNSNSIQLKNYVITEPLYLQWEPWEHNNNALLNVINDGHIYEFKKTHNNNKITLTYNKNNEGHNELEHNKVLRMGNNFFAIKAESKIFCKDDLLEDTVQIICFPDNTPIKTDQGIMNILDIGLQNTINNYKVLKIIRMINKDKKLILFKKGCISKKKNRPNNDTWTSLKHGIIMSGKKFQARQLVNNKDILIVDTNKKYVYNILLEKYTYFLVNNMLVESVNFYGREKIREIYENCNTKKLKICFITSLFCNDINDIDVPGKFEKIKDYDYYLFSNLNKDQFDTSWEIIKMDNINYKNNLIKSRYMKFMAWKYFKDIMKKNYDVIYYCDAYLSPCIKVNWIELSTRLLNCNFPFMQSYHKKNNGKGGIREECNRIILFKKDKKENINKTFKFIKNKKIGVCRDTFYENTVFGYDPNSETITKFLEEFWKLYSDENEFLSLRDQLLWNYLLLKRKYTPRLFEKGLTDRSEKMTYKCFNKSGKKKKHIYKNYKKN